MKILAGIGALALTLGVASAMPASAAEDYWRSSDDYWSHPSSDSDYMKRGNVDDGYRSTALMTRAELMREVRDQGYYDISDLRPNGFGGNWQATAHIDGELVTIVIDPYNGRVLSADEI